MSIDDRHPKDKYPKVILEGYPQNLRQEILDKHNKTTIGDLVQANYPIFGPDDLGGAYDPTYAGVGVGRQHKNTAEDLWNRDYNRTVPKGSLGIVVDKSEFNSLIDWFQHGHMWWCFPEEYEIVEKDAKDTDALVSGSTKD